jgi:FKBP-type peptidyl-prolyl cis-trans isomerase FkpA
MKITIPLLFILFLAFSCKKKQKEAEKQEEAIKTYISENGLKATATGSGLYYVIESQGNGQSCNANSTVKVAYKGYFLNGEVFDESNASGITFNLQNVIEGWTEGIPYFKKGGTGKLLIPSALGYGENDYNGIPGNSVLIFDIQLIDVL